MFRTCTTGTCTTTELEKKQDQVGFQHAIHLLGLILCWILKNKTSETISFCCLETNQKSVLFRFGVMFILFIEIFFICRLRIICCADFALHLGIWSFTSEFVTAMEATPNQLRSCACAEKNKRRVRWAAVKERN